MPLHLLRCQGLAVDDCSFALERLEAGTPSTFAQLGFHAMMMFPDRWSHRCGLDELRTGTYNRGYFHLRKYSSMESTTYACCSEVNSG